MGYKTAQMSTSWWNERHINASKQNRQNKKEVPNRDTDVGNGKQPSAILDILDN